jgi:ABC-type sugar transport system ATPase subunit
VIEFDRIGKRFPGVQALDDVSFTIRAGACHALLGENGAGKSTLGKILAGLYTPDTGTIRVGGAPLREFTPHAALASGIAIVHQELAICPNLSVAENLALQRLPRGRFGVDRSRLRNEARRLLEPVGLDVDPDFPASGLTLGEEQLLQIAVAVGQNARVIVFDEPTSSLGRVETERLFAIIRRLKSEGRTLVYVSHRLEELFALCDDVTVLRDGRHVETRALAGRTSTDLIRAMVGRDVVPSSAAAGGAAGGVVLQLDGVVTAPWGQAIALTVRAGEIVGLAGLVGAGRTELLESIAGVRPIADGRIELDGKSFRPRGVRMAQQAGVALIPEDRKRAGLVLGLNVADNLTLSFLDRFRGLSGRLKRGSQTRHAAGEIERLRIRTPGPETTTLTLSGGNQQKIVFSKGLEQGRRLLLVDEPTRGVDVAAKQEIHQLIRDRAAAGGAVLVASSELPELQALCDRILVLREGRIVAELARRNDGFDAEEIAAAMTGAMTAAEGGIVC